MAKFGRGKQERIKKAVKKLVTMGDHTLRQIPGVTSEVEKALRRKVLSSVSPALLRIREAIRKETRTLSRILTQTKKRLREISTPKKVYSAHEPEVTCITKNKAGKPHEYGVMVSLAVDKKGMVVPHAEYTDNQHDATTLGDATDGRRRPGPCQGNWRRIGDTEPIPGTRPQT